MNRASRPLVVVSLEDDDLDAELVAEHLRSGVPDVEVRRARARREYEPLIQTGDVDLVLSDFSLPDYDGWAALEAAKRHIPDVPFIFVSGAIGEARAIETLRRGATDYVLKDRLELLVPAVRRAVEVNEERKKRLAAEEERDRLLVSERHARELAESANRMKDEFLAIVSHELRTPLNAILGWSSLLADPNATEEMRRKGLTTIERNARIQARLIEDILDISRIVTGKLDLRQTPVQVTSFVGAAVDAVRPAAAAKGIELSVDLGSDVGQVRGDADRLQQVVWNLVSNAVKFTGKGGRVELRVERSGESVTLRVRDTGIGIDPAFLPYVFDRFRQGDASFARAHGGLGLGLAIVRSLVEIHGGTVAVESAGPHKGSTFSITLPRMANANEGAAIPPGRTASANDDDPLRGVRALVVDDDHDSRELTAFVLGSHGADVCTAASAAEAFDALRSFRADVVVSDIGMPHVDGYAFVRRLRALPEDAGGSVPAIALTAYAREMDRREAELAGYQRHLPKPVAAHQLVTAVCDLVRPSVAPGSAA